MNSSPRRSQSHEFESQSSRTNRRRADRPPRTAPRPIALVVVPAAGMPCWWSAARWRCVFPIITSVFAISLLSILLLVAGVATLVGAFWTGKWSGFLVNVLVGLLYLAAGFVVSEQPVLSILMVTVYLAVSFMVMGIFRIMAAMVLRFPQWGWALLNGCVTFLAGLVIYRHLPPGCGVGDRPAGRTGDALQRLGLDHARAGDQADPGRARGVTAGRISFLSRIIHKL